ncbi:MAG: 3-dehydroquinate synthase [Clostridiales bacterium]|nr:3-dehydroquinate synthase [Clostridiales bacterium]
MEKLTVRASGSYDVVIGDGLLPDAVSYLSPIIRNGAVTIVSDDKVYPLYGDALKRRLAANGNKAYSFVFPNGERSKNADVYIRLLNFLAESAMSRADTVVALGGGVVGDMAGFAAATYMRGIKVVQMPTSLLAAVDSSVGGKTGIDLKAGKNLAGVFYQPSLVLCDYRTFDTLDPAEFTGGMAEVIKHGILAGGELRELLYGPIKPNLEKIIRLNVQIKRDVVEADEREAGARKLLNLGHTIGHAVETLSSYALSHGQSVAIGTCLTARICAKQGVCSQAVADEVIKLFTLHGLPTETMYSAKEIADTARLDKKRKTELITWVWIEDLGRCVLKDIPMDDYEHLISLGLQQDNKGKAS